KTSLNGPRHRRHDHVLRIDSLSTRERRACPMWGEGLRPSRSRIGRSPTWTIVLAARRDASGIAALSLRKPPHRGPRPPPPASGGKGDIRRRPPWVNPAAS